MTKSDREEVRQIIRDLILPYQVRYEGHVEVTNISLQGIEKHLEKINNTTSDHDQIINENLPHTIDKCPQKNTITEIRDNMITIKAIKKAIILGIGLMSTIITLIFVILRFIFNY